LENKEIKTVSPREWEKTKKMLNWNINNGRGKEGALTDVEPPVDRSKRAFTESVAQLLQRGEKSKIKMVFAPFHFCTTKTPVPRT
jgi:hypothetical protein